MRKGRVGGGVLLIAVAVAAGACAHGNPKDGPVVDDLEIEGNKAVDDGDIKDKILTAETSWIPFLPKKRFDKNVWSSDLRRVERFYQSQGYYGAQVVDEEVAPDGEDAVKIRVRVTEGEPTKLTRVEVNGLESIPEAHRKRVMSVVGLAPGDVFVEETWEAMKGAIKDELIALGYAEATVEGEAKVDLGTRAAEIEVLACPGLRYRIGGVEVVQQGSKRVEPWRIEEQVREAVEQREWYSQNAALEAQQRVFDMGVFGAAQVRPGRGNPDTGTIPLIVEVTESPYHDVGFGFGVGVEQLRNEFHLIGEYTDRDFLGGLRELTLRARGGWAWIPNVYTSVRGGDAVTRSGPIARLNADLEQPRFLHPNFRLRTELEAQRAIEPAYSYTGGRARVSVPWRPRTWFTIEPAYNFEIYRLGSGETNEWSGEAPPLLFGCPGTCILSYLEQRFAYDRRDDQQEPRQGVYLAVSFQEGGGPLGGSFDYLRVIPEARGYISILPGRRLTFAGRVRMGSLIPLRGGDLDSPIVARFFSGGDNMRGFSAQRLAPMRMVEKDEPAAGTPDEDPMPIGGNGLFEASFETRYEITKGVILAGFADKGIVTTERIPLSADFGKLLAAVGTGVRYITPVGPIRLDLAYRLPIGPPLQMYAADGTPLPSNLPAGGCFGIGRGPVGKGGAPEGICAIHLSIGEAF